MLKPLIFSGNVFNGDLDMDTSQFVCVPSKPNYASVDLCLRANGNQGPNIVIAEIDNNCLSFEEKKKLGYEIQRRWNAVTELENLKQFTKECMRVAFEGGSLDGADLQDMGVEHGILSLTEYDPAKHGESAASEYDCNKGDPFYEYSTSMKEE